MIARATGLRASALFVAEFSAIKAEAESLQPSSPVMRSRCCWWDPTCPAVRALLPDAAQAAERQLRYRTIYDSAQEGRIARGRPSYLDGSSFDADAHRHRHLFARAQPGFPIAAGIVDGSSAVSGRMRSTILPAARRKP
jgi:hypothetical protein